VVIRRILQQHFFKVKMLDAFVTGLNVWLFNATVAGKMGCSGHRPVTRVCQSRAVVPSGVVVAIVAAGRAIAILCRRVRGSL